MKAFGEDMSKIFDIVIAGSGPAALSLAENTAKEGLSTLIISPTLRERWIPNYASWYSDIVSAGIEICIEETWLNPIVRTSRDSFELPFRYAKISTPQLQALLDVRCSRKGVQMLSEKVIAVQHYDDCSIVRLGDGNVRTCRVFVDATGGTSTFLRKEGSALQGYQTAYGLLMEAESATWDRGEMSLMDYRMPKNLSAEDEFSFAMLPTFLYAMPLGKNLIFLEETSLVSRAIQPKGLLKKRLHQRIDGLNIRPSRILDEEYCIIPMGGPRPDIHQQSLGFGSAAGLVHPATGYQLVYSLSLAPLVAQALRVGLEEGTPKEAVHLAWQQMWSKDQRRCWDMFQFGMDLLCSLSLEETQEFFSAFFSIPASQWKAFLSGQLHPFDVSRAMASVFLQASNTTRINLLQKATQKEGMTLFRSIFGFSYSS